MQKIYKHLNQRHNQYDHSKGVVLVPDYISILKDGTVIIRDSQYAPIYFNGSINKTVSQFSNRVVFDPRGYAGAKALFDLILRPTNGQTKLVKSGSLQDSFQTSDFILEEHKYRAEIVPESIIKSDDEKRYTFGVVYKASTPDHPIEDAHRDWMTADDIEKSQWDYVRKTGADRGIFIQHKQPPFGFIKGGEWVSIATLPFAVSGDFKHADGHIEKREIPAGSCWMGVIWTPECWPKVKSGQITGYSFGGSAQRLFDDE